MKKSKVIVRKLGRQKAFGMADDKKQIILIDPRQRSKAYLGTLIHEKLHLLFPDWSETKVAKTERELKNFLWENGYRKVDL